MGMRKEAATGDAEDVAVHEGEYIEAYQQFMIHHYGEELEAILLAEDDLLHYPLEIDFAELLEASPPLVKLLYTHPVKFLPLFNEATRLAQVSPLPQVAATACKYASKLCQWMPFLGLFT